MKNYYFFLMLLLMLNSSCEKDDFCIEPITPKMIIRFYNATNITQTKTCLLYTSDAADELDGVDLGGRRIIKKK